MSLYTLLMLELGGIQDFIFGSNNLQVNVGASALVAAITRDWIPSLLPHKHNIDKGGEAQPANIEDDVLAVEAIYIGGGNALLIFKEAGDANEFVRQISTLALVKVPGLKTVVEQITIDWENESLVNKLKELRHKLALRKQEPSIGQPLPGLGVTAACVFTGQAAMGEWRDPGGRTKLVSASVAARLEYSTIGKQYLNELVPEVTAEGLDYVSNFDHFGTKGESSYIAIVHADGNGMGERIETLSAGHEAPNKNRDYANKLRDFSASARKAARVALQSTIKKLLQCKVTDGEQVYWQRQQGIQPADRKRLPKVTLRREEGQGLLPFRPVVFGGDDITFVCDGRLGLALAEHCLVAYGEQELADGDKAVGRAGVAIVNTHFPFAQGYALAEELAGSAKEVGDEGKAASLDWHFGVNGVVQPLKTVREANYTVADGSLYARPLRLAPGTDWRHWGTYEQLVKEFQIGEDWRGRRNKLKALQSALRGGKAQTQAFLENYRLEKLPSIPNYPDFETQGWLGGACPYFDALEALDFHIPLEEPTP